MDADNEDPSKDGRSDKVGYLKMLMNQFTQMRSFPIVVLGGLLCLMGVLWPEPEHQRPLTVAVNVWPGTETLVMACDIVNTQDQRINVVEMSWPTAVMGAFRKRVVDAAVVTLDEMIRLEAEGAKPRAVLVLGISQGSDAVMGHPGQQSMAHLRGRNVGVELRSGGEYLLWQALAANGMTLQDVHVIPLNLAETEDAYHEKEMDAVVTTDPWCLRLLEKGAVALFDSRQTGLELTRVLVVREDALPTYRRELHSLVSACLKLNSPTGLPGSARGHDAILRRQGFTLSQWQKSLGRIHVPDAAENLRLMTQNSGGLEECLEKMIGTMRKQGLLRQEIKAQDLLIPYFLEESP
ncbi:MAG: hypothetical protein B7Z47_00825 [Chthoniobacter sp. 12-60-6]|nr:MAG: hypothetical protein B7Z47_00825 [Chthoniobacter sp. 12-60-6]